MKFRKNVLGAFEKVSFPDYAITHMLAKIDTGADTGAMHCTNVYESNDNGHKVLHFSPFDHPTMLRSTPKYQTRLVRSSNGDVERRYYIDTTIHIAGREYPIHLSLADRDKMNFQVLIGKRFLSEFKLLVDVTRDSA